MKAIIANLKVLIEDEKKSFETHNREKERLFDLAFSKDDSTKGAEVYKQYEAEYDKTIEASHKLRCLRHALASLRDALHEEYDRFFPEIGC